MLEKLKNNKEKVFKVTVGVIVVITFYFIETSKSESAYENASEEAEYAAKELERIHLFSTTYDLYDSLVYLKSDMKPVNALIYNRLGDIGVCLNGKREGVHRDWFDSRQLKFERNYTDGQRNGLCREWHENGRLRFEGNYKDDEMIGVQRFWYENGQLEEEVNLKGGKIISIKNFDWYGKRVNISDEIKGTD